MKKNTVNVRELVEKYQSNCERINAIADACEQEQRERTEAETKEYEALARENQLLSMKLQAATAEHLRENPNAVADAEKLIRENVAAGRKTEITLIREGEFAGMMVADANNGGIIPLSVQDFIKPLVEGFILNKVGLPMPTGLVGDFVWPIYDLAEASIAGEGVALSDSKINLSKLTASPERIGIAIPVTSQAVNQSAGLIETLVKTVMPQAVAQLLNKIVFGLNKATGATNLIGPFAHIVAKGGESPSTEDQRYADLVAVHETPTFAELNVKLKAKVLETGIDGAHLCWVMTKSMQAVLEGTPINSNGIYVPMVQDGKLCGLPIHTSNVMRKAVVTYKKATVGQSATTWAPCDKPATEAGIDFKVTVTPNGEAAALAALDNVSSNDVVEITTVTEYIGLGDWGYQPMGLFNSLRFVVDPFSQARKDAVDFVLNADYATKTLRPEAFRLAAANVANA
jgi:HK97 family phage major capsid protein